MKGVSETRGLCWNSLIRENFSTWHTFFFNMETGEPDHGAACQGYRDGSAWARGKAWGIYGSAHV